jgi:hypothetical protein
MLWICGWSGQLSSVASGEAKAVEQRTIGEMRMLLFRARQLVADNTYTLTSNYYFRYELQLLLEKAGFTIEAVKGDWTDADVTADHDIIVYFARNS